MSKKRTVAASGTAIAPARDVGATAENRPSAIIHAASAQRGIAGPCHAAPGARAFHERHGTQGRAAVTVAGRRTWSDAARVRTAMIPHAGCRSPAENNKPAAPPPGVCRPGLSQSKPFTPRGAPKPFDLP